MRSCQLAARLGEGQPGRGLVVRYGTGCICYRGYCLNWCVLYRVDDCGVRSVLGGFRLVVDELSD